MALNESRFKKFDPGPCLKRPAYAHFGLKLQKIFPLPPDHTEPADVRVLLSKLEAKLNAFPATGESSRTPNSA